MHTDSLRKPTLFLIKRLSLDLARAKYVLGALPVLFLLPHIDSLATWLIKRGLRGFQQPPKWSFHHVTLPLPDKSFFKIIPPCVPQIGTMGLAHTFVVHLIGPSGGGQGPQPSCCSSFFMAAFSPLLWGSHAKAGALKGRQPLSLVLCPLCPSSA